MAPRRSGGSRRRSRTIWPLSHSGTSLTTSSRFTARCARPRQWPLALSCRRLWTTKSRVTPCPNPKLLVYLPWVSHCCFFTEGAICRDLQSPLPAANPTHSHSNPRCRHHRTRHEYRTRRRDDAEPTGEAWARINSRIYGAISDARRIQNRRPPERCESHDCQTWVRRKSRITRIQVTISVRVQPNGHRRYRHVPYV